MSRTLDFFSGSGGILFKSSTQYLKDFHKAHSKNNKKILKFLVHIRKKLGIKD